MRLLVFGKTGQVAQELARRRPPGIDVTLVDRQSADLSIPQTCIDIINTTQMDAVINAAAWTAVDRCETEEAAATAVNGKAPGAMARACADLNVPFLHISTDYVFDGSGDQPFTPLSPAAPIGAYGRSKLSGEEAVRTSEAHHLILRTSWVFSAYGENFLKTMLRLGNERTELRVVADQVGGPTPAAAIADSLFTCGAAMINGHPGGTFHFAGAPDTSWADFARAIMQTAGLQCRIDDIASSDYPTPAQRPLNSRLDCAEFTRDFGIIRPDWKTGLEDIIMELGKKS